jgi:DNA polymerase-3 subunit gamma/tau
VAAPAAAPAEPKAAGRPAATGTGDRPGGGSASPPGTPAGLDAVALRQVWPEILERVKVASRRTKALLDNAQVHEVTGSTVTLSAPGALAKMIAEKSNTTVLQAALTATFGGDWAIAVDNAPTPAAAGGDGAAHRGASAPPPEPDPRDDADYEPRVTAAPPVNQEAEAIKLVTAELGARPVES